MKRKIITIVMLLAMFCNFVCAYGESLEDIDSALQGEWVYQENSSFIFENGTIRVIQGSVSFVGTYTINVDSRMIDSVFYSSDNQKITMHSPFVYEDGILRLFNNNNEEFVKKNDGVSNVQVNSSGDNDAVYVGKIIKYGHYEQDNNTANGTEAIEWIVLEYDETQNRALLISRYGLDAEPYHPGYKDTEYPTWAKSYVRDWLNETFLNSAFTENEQNSILSVKISTPSYEEISGGANTLDQIWLLSGDEALQYFSSDDERIALPTQYAIARGARVDAGACWWWLRSPCNYSCGASFVYHEGGIAAISNVNFNMLTVRPAFWLDLDSAVIY